MQEFSKEEEKFEIKNESKKENKEYPIPSSNINCNSGLCNLVIEIHSSEQIQENINNPSNLKMPVDPTYLEMKKRDILEHINNPILQKEEDTKSIYIFILIKSKGIEINKKKMKNEILNIEKVNYSWNLIDVQRYSHYDKSNKDLNDLYIVEIVLNKKKQFENVYYEDSFPIEIKLKFPNSTISLIFENERNSKIIFTPELIM